STVMSLTYVGWASDDVVVPERPTPTVIRRG
ncbi:MAG: hypothetical protein RLZ86_1920, partial [Actinomycetota bacterium]